MNSKIKAMAIKYVQKRIDEKGIPSPLYPWEPWEYIANAMDEVKAKEGSDAVRDALWLVLAQFVDSVKDCRVRGALSAREVISDDLPELLESAFFAKGRRVHYRRILPEAMARAKLSVANVVYTARLLESVHADPFYVFDIDARLGEGLLATAIVAHMHRGAKARYRGIAPSREIARNLSEMAKFLKIDAEIFPAGKQPCENLDVIKSLRKPDDSCILYIPRRIQNERLTAEDAKRGNDWTPDAVRQAVSERARWILAQPTAHVIAAHNYSAGGQEFVPSDAVREAVVAAQKRGELAKIKVRDEKGNYIMTNPRKEIK